MTRDIPKIEIVNTGTRYILTIKGGKDDGDTIYLDDTADLAWAIKDLFDGVLEIEDETKQQKQGDK